MGKHFRQGFASCVMLVCLFARADEGMWLFNRLPIDEIYARYGVSLSPESAEHMMNASVRFTNGSGSFVSSQGLILTNHHVALDLLSRISTASRNIVRDGFLAKDLTDEIPIPGSEVIQLVGIEDVTDRVKTAVLPEMNASQAHQARTTVIAQIESESHQKTGLRSDVVTLFQGGQYHLYKYKQYTDIRLVFAPEFAMGFFGGDPDNFEYPRYSLDMTFVRAYENGKPVNPHRFFAWSFDGPKENDVVFVSGHPGTTNRLFTVAAMEYLRDFQIPTGLETYERLKRVLDQFASKNAESQRRSRKEIFAIENNLKRSRGWLHSFDNKSVLEGKANQEKQLREWIDKTPEIRAQIPGLENSWAEIESAVQARKELTERYTLLESGTILRTRFFGLARALVRASIESEKPDGTRLPEFRDANRTSLELALFSTEPIYPDLEEAKLVDALKAFSETSVQDADLVKQVLAGKSPEQRARELVRESQLGDPEVRRAIYENGSRAIQGSSDPFIRLAVVLDSSARAVRSQWEARVVEVEKQAYSKIAQAMFERFGDKVYPDATFTLRLSFGTVKGYRDGHNAVPAMTTLGGAFHHEQKHDGKEPWKLPRSWHEARGTFDESSSFNFISNHDIIGGNSGSPVVSQCGKTLVGLVFDSNAAGLGAANAYEGEKGRTVSVSSKGMAEALRHIYRAENVVRELGW